MKKCPDFFKTKRICLKAGVSMGTGFSSTEGCVWKRLAACHRAEEREMHAHYCTPFYCLLFCWFWWGFFLLCSVVSFLSAPQKSLCNTLPGSGLHSLHSYFLTALTLTLCLNPPSSMHSVCFPWCQRDDQTRSPAPTSESAATCTCWKWLWGSGLQALWRLADQVSAVLIQLTSFVHTVCQHLQSDF